MRILHCPRCRQITEQLESFGSCEHCGIDAVTAGDPIETEGLDPELQAAALARWRRFTATFWLATACYEWVCFVLLLLCSQNARFWDAFHIDLNYLMIVAALIGLGLTLAIVLGSVLYKWRLLAAFGLCAAALLVLSCVSSWFYLVFNLRTFISANIE